MMIGYCMFVDDLMIVGKFKIVLVLFALSINAD